MGRIFGLVLIAAFLYLAATTYLGESPGFGSAASEPPPSTAQRAGERVQQAFDEGATRREALLPE
jgi:hypothetical protein